MVRRCVHGHALAVADDQRGVRPPGLGGGSFSLALACSSVGHASSPTRSHFTKLKMPGSERMFSVSSCLCPPARSRMSWLRTDGPPSPKVQHGPPRTYCSGRPSAPPGPGSARSSASWTPGAPPRPALAASPQWSGPGASFRCPAGP